MPRRKSATTGVRLHFTDPEATGETGAVIFDPDTATIRFELPSGLRKSLSRATSAGSEAVQKWGISLLAGFTFAGGVLTYRKHRNAGYAAFAAAGLTGIGGWWLRRTLGSLPALIAEPLPAKHVRLLPQNDGGLTIVVSGGGLRKLTVSLRSGEFDAAEAEAFQHALTDSGE